MSGKFKNSSPRQPQKRRLSPMEITLIVVAAVLAVLLCVMLVLIPADPSQNPAQDTTPATTLPGQTQPSGTEPQTSTTETEETPTETETEATHLPMDLGQGLIITDIDDYTGAYVEDGSDAVVSGVLMLILENTSEEALQYARITLYFGGIPAEFTVTNLPAGQRVVLLEKNRAAFSSKVPDSVELADVLFLPEFEMYEEIFEISGTKGNLTVKNISETDIAGDVYVYYKNSAQDLLYGGITYRARVEGGLKAGESKQVIAAHYNPTGSTILMVTYIP